MGVSKSRRQRGNGSIFQRSRDRKWVAQISYVDVLTRKRVNLTRVANSRKDARDKLAELKANIGGAQVQTSSSTTFAEYAERWMEVSLPLAGLRPKTVTMNTSRIRGTLIPLMGAVKVSDLTTEHIESFMHQLRARKGRSGTIAPSTQRIDFDLLSKILDRAVRDGLLARNPCEGVPRPRVSKTTVAAHSADHVELILDQVKDEQIEPLVRFVADTGCRIGEALGLEWDDVELQQKTVNIVRSSTDSQTTKTDAGTRVVPLLPEVVNQLDWWRKEQAVLEAQIGEGWPNSRGLVFTTNVGTPLAYRNATRSLLKAIDTINENQPENAQVSRVSPWHTFRHSLATRLLNRGVPMPVVSSIVGHASIRTTVDIYGHAEAAISAEAMGLALGRGDEPLT